MGMLNYFNDATASAMLSDTGSPHEMFLFVMFMAASNGVCSIAAGIVMYPAFGYITKIVGITAPDFWASIGLVFVVRQAVMLISAVRLFGGK